MEETYQVDLVEEAKEIINALKPWKIDDWIVTEYDNTWYPDIVTEVSPVGSNGHKRRSFNTLSTTGWLQGRLSLSFSRGR